MKRPTAQSGFTIIELVVTIGIFTLLSGIVLVKYRSFNTNSEFANSVENVYLALRETQVYGAGGRRDNLGAGCGTPASLYNCAYGVYFTKTTPEKYDIFVDTNGNRIMDAGESIQAVPIGIRTAVTSLFCVRSGISDPCTNNYASITFKRPSPDAFIAEADSPVNSNYGAEITISNGIKTAKIIISEAGQISIQ